MPLPKNVNAYLDVKSLIDGAIASGAGANLMFDSYNRACRFRQRFYMFRKLYSEEMRGQPTPYDSCILKNSPDKQTLRLELSQPPVEVLFDNPKADLVPQALPADPLLTEALGLAVRLGINEPD